MPKITNEEYVKRALKFVEEHKDSYTPKELEFIYHNINRGLDYANTSDVLRQLYDEAGLHDIKYNVYEGFISLLEQNFDLNTDIIEIGGGRIPSLGKKIALRQKKGTVTVYDPRLITNIEKPSNLILKPELFDKTTAIGDAKLLIGYMPCEAAVLLVDSACKNKIDFMLALCEGGTRNEYGWLEDDHDWICFVRYCAIRGIENNSLGSLEQCYLEQYNNPYPVIYNKRKKS